MSWGENINIYEDNCESRLISSHSPFLINELLCMEKCNSISVRSPSILVHIILLLLLLSSIPYSNWWNTSKGADQANCHLLFLSQLILRTQQWLILCPWSSKCVIKSFCAFLFTWFWLKSYMFVYWKEFHSWKNTILIYKIKWIYSWKAC